MGREANAQVLFAGNFLAWPIRQQLPGAYVAPKLTIPQARAHCSSGNA
jgi:hypothetical protein